MNNIYSYRIVINSGFAPCVDNGLFSLACCKRDMRRVIGRQYINKKSSKVENPIYIVAVYAKHNYNEANGGKWLYCAKITDVVTYYEYFTNKRFDNRKDCIYKILNPKEFKGNNHRNIEWEHNGVNNIHIDKETQEKDWDKVHGQKECYVLLSDEFRFFAEEEAGKLFDKFGSDKIICARIGHKPIKNNELQQDLELLLKKGKNINEVKESIKKCSNTCSKKEKAV